MTYFIAVFIALSATGLVSAQQSGANSSEKEVQAAENDWISLMLKPNAQNYNKLVADDFLQNNQFGVSLN
jgi:hypothetical protein